MPLLFYFDLMNGHDALDDDEGVEADDANQAIEQALAVIEEYRTNGELQNVAPDWELVVRDARGTEIKRIAL